MCFSTAFWTSLFFWNTVRALVTFIWTGQSIHTEAEQLQKYDPRHSSSLLLRMSRQSHPTWCSGVCDGWELWQLYTCLRLSALLKGILTIPVKFMSPFSLAHLSSTVIHVGLTEHNEQCTLHAYIEQTSCRQLCKHYWVTSASVNLCTGLRRPPSSRLDSSSNPDSWKEKRNLTFSNCSQRGSCQRAAAVNQACIKRLTSAILLSPLIVSTYISSRGRWER